MGCSGNKAGLDRGTSQRCREAASTRLSNTQTTFLPFQLVRDIVTDIRRRLTRFEKEPAIELINRDRRLGDHYED